MPYSRNGDLPKTVRSVLPDEAQTVYRKAFNGRMEQDDANEGQAHAAAWRAVKRQWSPPAKEAGMWSRRAGDGIMLEDAITFDGVRLTGDGYLTATAKVARTGIQTYRGYEVGRPELDTVRVYRSPEHVFDDAALRSFAHRPVTIDHPTEAVTSDNWKQLAVGQTGDEVDARDGKFVKVPLVLMDAAAIKAVQEGKRELSMGYKNDLLWEDGVSPEGEAYDAVQTNLRMNHLAIVERARGGSELRIGDRHTPDADTIVPPTEGARHMSTDRKTSLVVDGLTVEMDARDAEVVKRTIEKLTSDNADLAKRLADAEEKSKKDAEEREKEDEEKKKETDAKDAEIATLKKQLADAEVTPAKLDQMVKDRDAVIAKAKAMIGDKLTTDGQTDSEIRRQVVSAQLGDVAKDWSDDQVAVSFQTLTAAVKDAKPGSGSGVGAILLDKSTTQDAAETARIARDKRLSDAWKGNSQAAS